MTVNNLVPFDFGDISPNIVFKHKSKDDLFLRPVLVDKNGVTFFYHYLIGEGVESKTVTYAELRSRYLGSIDAKHWYKCEKVSNSSS